MPDIDFRFYSFRENIVEKVLADLPCENTVYVFPTESSKRYATREFRQNWTFSDTRFLTMEELKESLFVSPDPLLKNEKRTIAFYAALSEDDRNFFRISNYFQSLELSSNFFDLWNQFNEELVDENIDPAVFDAELLEWQVNTYDRLLRIKRQYRNLITERGFEDTIFLYTSPRFRLDDFRLSDRFVFVNQFYYTRLERDIIHKIAERNKQVTITYQLPQSFVDRESLRIREFSLQDLNVFRTEKIDIIESDNDFAAFTSLLLTLKKTGIRQVVDISFLNEDYARFLSPSAFRLGSGRRFTDSSLYRFFAAFSDVMYEIIWDQGGREYLLPLESLLNAISIPDFIFYFCDEDKSEQQQLCLDTLYHLIENDYKYIDLRGKVLATSERTALRKILGFIEFFLEIDTISGFVDWIDSAERGVKINRLVLPSEHMYSDILDTFYNTLSDFKSLQSPDFVKNWRDLFGKNRGRTIISSGLLRLFVDMMKSKTVRLSFNPSDSTRIDITDLLDTRNMSYSQVAVLNLVEGKLPHKRQIPFLFTEKQRRNLNLKTYEDVKLREKYYFFRLILTTPRVYLFSQKNLAENIEPSSFLEEVKLENPCPIGEESKPDRNYLPFYRTILDCSDYRPPGDRVQNADFYSLPLKKQQDFPANSVDLTFYDYKELKDNPFVFFLRRLCRIENRPKNVTAGYSPKLIGNIVHDILDQIWRILLETPGSVGDLSLVDEELIAGVFDRVMTIKKRYNYQIPHDFTSVYFDEIVKPDIRNGIIVFFTQLASLGFGRKDIKVFPEYAEEKKSEYKTLFPAGRNSLGMPVRIRGRADLRIHTANDRFHIFDYKTGGSDDEQLILYELYYYLIDTPLLLHRVFSHFVQILPRKGENSTGIQKSAGGQERADRFKSELLSQIERIVTAGFNLPDKKASRRKWADITRSDLFVHIGENRKPD